MLCTVHRCCTRDQQPRTENAFGYSPRYRMGSGCHRHRGRQVERSSRLICGRSFALPVPYGGQGCPGACPPCKSPHTLCTSTSSLSPLCDGGAHIVLQHQAGRVAIRTNPPHLKAPEGEKAVELACEPRTFQ